MSFVFPQAEGVGEAADGRPRLRVDESGDGDESARVPYRKLIDRLAQGVRRRPVGEAVFRLVEQPALMSYYELSSEERKAAGIEDDLFRLAVGVEDEADVVDDVMQALEAK